MNVVNPNRTGRPRQCSRCSAWYDASHNAHGRGSDRPDLCDVCYWRTKYEELREALAWMREVTQFDPWYALKHVQEYGREDWQDVQEDFLEIRRNSRAAVDALVGEE